jgi:glycosyltransferase involved in cell wall biosynthesis
VPSALPADAVDAAMDRGAVPSVSLVVIGYNEAERIEPCLASIFAQEGLADFEVIVVDDGSTDEMSAVVERLQPRHPELRLIRHPANRGRGAARRTGQDACRADRIGFIDSDILLPPDWLARATSALEHADAVSGVAVPDGDVAVIWRMFRPVPKGMVGYWSLTGNNVLFRRSALEVVGWPAESRLTEDNRMAIAMDRAGLHVETIRDLKVEHREAKSYRKAVAFLWETGFNATEILRDLRRFRFPDLVWVCWLVAVVALVVLAVTGTVSWWVALVGAVALTVLVDVGAMVQRFYFWRAPGRWLLAAAANLPPIATYLVSRTAHAPRLVLRRRSVLH